MKKETIIRIEVLLDTNRSYAYYGKARRGWESLIYKIDYFANALSSKI
jgi:hypothetical protein